MSDKLPQIGDFLEPDGSDRDVDVVSLGDLEINGENVNPRYLLSSEQQTEKDHRHRLERFVLIFCLSVLAAFIAVGLVTMDDELAAAKTWWLFVAPIVGFVARSLWSSK